jgi:hypothetical protein
MSSWAGLSVSFRRKSGTILSIVVPCHCIACGKSRAKEPCMIRPRYLPPDAYFDDPAEKLDHGDHAASDRNLAFVLASTGLTRVGDWITRGRGGITQRALRVDIVLVCICPQFLPCKRPSAAWVGRQHGVSRTRVNHLRKDFAGFIAPYIQFRGQRFLNRGNPFQNQSDGNADRCREIDSDGGRRRGGNGARRPATVAP